MDAGDPDAALLADAFPNGDECRWLPPCPAPTAGKITVCGRIFDAETSLPIDDDLNDMGMGPESHVEVRLYDPLAFIADPVSAVPVSEVVYPNTCGWFVAKDIAPPFNGYIAVVIDDVSADGTDDYWPTAVATTQAAGQTIAGLNAFATTKSTDCAWSLQAGLVTDCAAEATMTFAARGVYLAVFIDPTLPHVGPFQGTPVPGVRTTQSGATDAAKDFYFSDSDPLTRSMVDATADSTGVDGSALWINGTLVSFSGIGGEPAGCMWPSTLAATPAGAVFFQERNATGGPCGM